MKKISLLILLLATLTANSHAQTVGRVADTTKVFYVADRMPQFPGGRTATIAFLSQNLQYPVIGMEAGMGARVLVMFVVGKDGSIKTPSVKSCTLMQLNRKAMEKLPKGEQVKIRKACADAFSKEALRVVSLMPKWEPGELNGEKMNVAFTLPITFRLQ